ncbi:hypothetical protein NDU88_001076 [Pleurodeles waltl]|uniref:Uncharacterized protein n=1 Tax=Pleurodeles waltl TaxID=8319 RepID=A0AAV7VAV0_PLEWA|nr:hypothetical protein NDU88_001076 [Pleurodeles waltl]
MLTYHCREAPHTTILLVSTTCAVVPSTGWWEPPRRKRPSDPAAEGEGTRHAESEEARAGRKRGLRFGAQEAQCWGMMGAVIGW